MTCKQCDAPHYETLMRGVEPSCECVELPPVHSRMSGMPDEYRRIVAGMAGIDDSDHMVEWSSARYKARRINPDRPFIDVCDSMISASTSANYSGMWEVFRRIELRWVLDPCGDEVYAYEYWRRLKEWQEWRK